MSEPCCRKCRGDTPHLFCRAKQCFCHVVRNHLVDSGLPYSDPTSRKAIRRADRKKTRRNRRPK